MASSEPVESTNFDILDASHRQAFELALTRVLQTERAELTFAEIIDGLPTRRSYEDFQYPQGGHPATTHLELCPGILEKTREFRSSFTATSLSFRLPLLHAFAETDIGSRPFHLRLLELLAVSCHQIAVYLYQLDGVNHTHRDYEVWINQPRDMNQWDSFRHPTAFTHSFYTDFEQYPSGVADMVGYWAEARIFGGVIVFDRGESETECRDVYLHAGRWGGPYTLFPPTTEQFERLTEFLLGTEASLAKTECPIPIKASSKNRWRWDPWEAIANYHIFRDKYERSFSPTKPLTEYRSSSDWPEIADDLYLVNAMFQHRDGNVLDKDEIRAALERLQQVTPSSPVWHNLPVRHSWTDNVLDK